MSDAAKAISAAPGIASWFPGPVKLWRMRPAGTDTDAGLIERSQQGERAAFEELVRRHADRLYGVILRFLGDPDDASEATQEAFLRAWRGIGRFQGGSEFFTWLYRIGLNEAKRLGGKRSRDDQLGRLDGDELPEVSDLSQAPEPRLAQGELRRVLERAVRGLPTKYRAPLILRDIEGLSTRQAAQVMDLREAAFKSRLHRARLAVREAVDAYEVEEEL
ncbi:RNA polymerase sigma factor RpoE [soil metagenome]